MWSNRSFRSLLAGAATVLVAASPLPAAAQTPASFCQGGLGIALIDVPARTQNDPRARTYIVDHVQPGATLERRVRICNGTSGDLAVKVYAGAATIDDGTFRAVEGRADNELSRWIDLVPDQVTVPSGGEVITTARIQVPQDASGGERYAAILAERPAVPQASGIAVAGRVGVRVYLSVGGPEEPASDFVVDTLQGSRREDGRPVVDAVVRNTGERALDMSGELRLTEGPGGLSAGPFPATLGTTLAPGDEAPVEVVLDERLPDGPWLATLLLKSGTLERKAEATITFPASAGEQAAPVQAKNLPLREDPKILVPIAIALLGILSLLLLTTGLITSRRRARLKQAAPA